MSDRSGPHRVVEGLTGGIIVVGCREVSESLTNHSWIIHGP